MPVILATQEAEIRRIQVQSQPGQIVQESPSQKKKKTFRKTAGGVAQGVGPEFKRQYRKKIKKSIVRSGASIKGLATLMG
jgi:hypothetical protein